MESVNLSGGDKELRFEDALMELGFLTSEALQAALKHVMSNVAKPSDLPPALIDAGVISRDQARDAFYLQLARRYQNAFEGYEILETLGQGAVGTVFRAFEPRRERDVAIKVLDERMARFPDVRQAFLTEARRAVKLSHPNIVQGFEVLEVDGLCAFVMELVEGRTVDALVNARGPMEERQALNIVRDISRALEHAEESGLVHRDIKPANIIVGRNRVAKLLDMGLAKVVVGPGSDQSDGGMAVGTPNYMSPEQIRGARDIGSRADIYSLGATLFFMMTGQTPFTGKPEVVMYKHIHEPPASPKNLRPDVSQSIVNLIFLMMAKDPEHRPSTATALIEAIDDCLSNVGKAVAPTPPMILPTPPAEPSVVLPSRGGRGRKKGRRQRFGNNVTQSPSAPSLPSAPAPSADGVNPTPISMPEALAKAAAEDGQAMTPQPLPVPIPMKKATPKRHPRRNMR